MSVARWGYSLGDCCRRFVCKSSEVLTCSSSILSSTDRNCVFYHRSINSLFVATDKMIEPRLYCVVVFSLFIYGIVGDLDDDFVSEISNRWVKPVCSSSYVFFFVDRVRPKSMINNETQRWVFRWNIFEFIRFVNSFSNTDLICWQWFIESSLAFEQVKLLNDFVRIVLIGNEKELRWTLNLSYFNVKQLQFSKFFSCDETMNSSGFDSFFVVFYSFRRAEARNHKEKSKENFEDSVKRNHQSDDW